VKAKMKEDEHYAHLVHQATYPITAWAAMMFGGGVFSLAFLAVGWAGVAIVATVYTLYAFGSFLYYGLKSAAYYDPTQ
jgi:hypothetical protein